MTLAINYIVFNGVGPNACRRNISYMPHMEIWHPLEKYISDTMPLSGAWASI